VITASIPEIKPNSSPQEVAEIIRGKLQDFYIKKAEEEVLKPMLITLDLFRGQQRQLSDTLLNQILMKLGNFNLDVNIVVAGINQQSGTSFLGMVQGNGVLLDKTMDCAVTNGSGGDLARFSILLSNYSKNLNTDEVGKIVKDALIASKKSPGVGDLGDFVILPASPHQAQQQAAMVPTQISSTLP
jgi:hypothetical protein